MSATCEEGHRWRRVEHLGHDIMACRVCHVVHPEDVVTVAIASAEAIAAGRPHGLVVRR